MSILRDFEKRLEGAVEGFFARAFRSGLQPVELAKALQRYAANYQQVGLESVFVPNVYRFVLSPDDLERFSGFSGSLRRELADVVVRTSGDRGWQLQGPVRIDLVKGDHVRTGTYELRGKVEAPEPAHVGAPPPAQPFPPARAAPLATQVLAPPPIAAELVSDDGRRFVLSGSTVIGRLPECDVTLDDPSVSRRHARVIAANGRFVVEDLGSTNGVRVNGGSTRQATLTSGDVIDLGGVRLVFSAGR